jgi:hypothetical protein
MCQHWLLILCDEDLEPCLIVAVGGCRKTEEHLTRRLSWPIDSSERKVALESLRFFVVCVLQ